jgi:hypothetical protein
MNISKITKATALSLVLWFASGVVFAQSYEYDTLATIEGTLISSTAEPEITYDEKSHQFPALKLLKPISVLCSAKKTDSCQPETGVTLLHLVLKEKQMKQFKKLKGKTVKLSGNLFHSDNGHHFTSVLLDVESINP